jgi:hypothetical protein
MKLFLVLICGMILAPSLRADEPTPGQRAEQFLQTLQKGDVNKAVDDLSAGSAVMTEKKQMMDTVKAKIKATLPRYGKSAGYEVATEKPYGTSVVRLVYILKLEKHPLIWDFYFYRPNKSWICAQFTFNDRFAGLQ